MANEPAPALYGITEQNSNRAGPNLWGKNQFNSTFPLSLCLMMRDDGVRPVYLTAGNNIDITNSDDQITMDAVVGPLDANPSYLFEAQFVPYAGYLRNQNTQNIDIVVLENGNQARPLEVKLTVVPDIATAGLAQDRYAPELVIRSITSAYAMMGLGHSLRNNDQIRGEVVECLRPAYERIADWGNVAEIRTNTDNLINAMTEAIGAMTDIQSPFLIQPIWCTEGQNFRLMENCFDVFVWSDLAVMSIPIHMQHGGPGVPRATRDIARHVRALYDLCTQDSFNYDETYAGMALGMQTDKGFSVSGRTTVGFMECPRLREPHYTRQVLRRIILNDGENMLSPERRFDLAVALEFQRMGQPD